MAVNDREVHSPLLSHLMHVEHDPLMKKVT